MINLENQTDSLFRAALRKCGNLTDAEDLTQETLLAALLYEANGKPIGNLRSWLMTTLHRKYCDMLRRRYRRPYISIGEDFDLLDESLSLDEVGMTAEEERVRREVAFLTAQYREVIIRHYMYRQEISEIAHALGIPLGTVKSRLAAGRERMKKGIDTMEHYDEKSYDPITLRVSHSGCAGLNDEPCSLVNHDLIAQNLLYLAYEKPITETELAKAIGIPTAYLDPIINRLIEGELMKRTGDRLYTDFILFSFQDRERFLSAQKQFAAEQYDRIAKPYTDFYRKLRNTEVYRRLKEEQRDALEMFCFFNIFDNALYAAFSRAFQADQIFPERKDGGAWIAFGTIYDKRRDDYFHAEEHKYLYAGQRNIFLKQYLGAKGIRLSVFDPSGFPCRIYSQTSNGISDENLIKLLYLIASGQDIRDSGFDEQYLKSIPWLISCNILCEENGRMALRIPVFDRNEIRTLDTMIGSAQSELADSLEIPLKTFLQDKKTPIPPHLKSVPLQKQYLYSHNAMLMLALRQAMSSGMIRDGGYDNEVQPPYPMILVIEN